DGAYRSAWHRQSGSSAAGMRRTCSTQTEEVCMRRFAWMAIAAWCGCAAGTDDAAPGQGLAEGRGQDDKPNPALFPQDASPYGVSMERWSELIWRWIYRQPLAQNPLIDQTGADCGVGQEGPVWFLPSVIPGAPLFVGERSCTVPSQRALLVQAASFLNDYPCPD